MKNYMLIIFLLAAPGIQAQWEPDIRLTNDPGNSYSQFGMAHNIIACGDTLHVVWYDDRHGNWEIYYDHSADDGLTWGPEIRITDNLSTSNYPSLDVSGTSVHLVWSDDMDGNREIYYIRSSDGGENWGAVTRLSYSTYASYSAVISASGSLVNVIWVDFNNSDMLYELHYISSEDGGTTWNDEFWLTPGTSFAINPSIASSDPDVHVVWSDSRDGNAEIYYKRSIDGGVNWGPDTRLTFAEGESRLPSLVLSGNYLHVAWEDSRDGNFNVYYVYSPDNGENWSDAQQVTFALANSWGPNVTAQGPVIYVVWEDYRNVHPDIYYNYSTNCGESWSEDVRLNDYSFNSQLPFISVSGSSLHTIWQDQRDGNFEIYYKRDPNGGNPVSIPENNADIGISVYPNPASRQITVGQLDSWTVGQLEVSGRQSAVRFSIVDHYGREVKDISNVRSLPYQLDVSGLSGGVYILMVFDDSGNAEAIKFVIALYAY